MVQAKQVKPFFTIITCTKNSSKFIGKCLNSVKKQTFRDFEHLIIDGKSKDGTLELVKKFKNQIISTAPSGIANAMNLGITNSSGEYLYFLNSDDYLFNDQVLENVHHYLESNPELDWVFGNIHETDGVKTIGYPPFRKIFQGKHPNLLKYYNYIPHQATFIKKQVFSDFGLFDESLSSMLDPEYWLRIAGFTRWGYMPYVVANYLIHEGSQSENPAHAKHNTQEYESVQKRYLNPLEYTLAKLINKFIR